MPGPEARQPGEWARAARVDEMRDGEGRVVDAGGRWLALFRVGAEHFAVDNACPHMAGPLGAGRLDGYVVTCPLHYWRIDVRTGRSPTNEHVTVERFETRVVEGWVEVKIR
jgi:nitrite reductase (NADH) small subunit